MQIIDFHTHIGEIGEWSFGIQAPISAMDGHGIHLAIVSGISITIVRLQRITYSAVIQKGFLDWSEYE